MKNRIINLYEIDNMSVDEIAAYLKISRETVKEALLTIP